MDSWKREGTPDALDASVSTGILSLMPATQLTSYRNYRSTAMIESLHEITEIAQM